MGMRTYKKEMQIERGVSWNLPLQSDRIDAV